MDRQQLVDRLQLNNQSLVDKDVHSICAFQLYRLVDDREGNLALELEPRDLQLEAETFFISRLQEARPERPMNFNGVADDYPHSADRGLSRVLSFSSVLLCVSVSL